MRRALVQIVVAAGLAASEQAPPAAVAAAQRADWPAAVAACAGAFDPGTSAPDFWSVYARAALGAGDLRLAGELVGRGMVRFPAQDDLRRLELSLLVQARRPDEAAAAARSWLRTHGEDVDAWQALAWAAHERHDDAGLSAALEAAVILRPDDAGLRTRLAHTLRRLGQPQAALAHYRQLIGAADHDLRLAAAACAGEAGDPRQGLDWLHGDDAAARLLAARLHVQAGDTAAARDDLERLIAAGEHDARILTWAGHLAEQAGDPARAEACWSQASLDPEADAAPLRLAELYRRTARPAEARAVLERRLSARPGDVAARAMLDALPR